MTLVKFNNRTRNTAPYFNNVFDSLFSEAINKNLTINKVPGVNILETETEYKIEIAAPGLTKEDFQINLKKDTLSVWAEKKTSETEEKKDYTRREFDYFSFARSFVLPESVNADNITAEYVNGILNITIGKDEVKSQNKEIKVS
ncbi:Hsp20/alpha crystallin family protein [Pedobacter panaciterrae]|jgi:Molecular chaperone (small heat shock protein)|uniref:Hsp20/alpha crystallin family protein n=1 Tax=Pedobacter panaciterrae TaxID=363849 RepID=A0ABU8NJK5_9SPHI|nr:Hsp20/alpha crystallin family protein [Pedobacter panaciterrae]NQX56044.1 Hsp20/alpha crystallin family protein [Pedobacter panaciterrae]